MSDDRIRDDEPKPTDNETKAEPLPTEPPARRADEAGVAEPPRRADVPAAAESTSAGDRAPRPVPGAGAPAEGEAPEQTTPAGPPRPVGGDRPRPLPPTWMDLSAEEVERLIRQVNRAFSSEPFTPLAQGAGGGRERGQAAAGPEVRLAAEPPRPAPAGRADAGASAERASRREEAAAGAESEQEPSDAEAREGGRRRRRGSRGRGRRRRREGGEVAAGAQAGLEATADPEASFAESAAPAPAGREEQPPVREAADLPETAPERVEADARAEASPPGPALEEAEEGEGRRGRRRRRRGREREERRETTPERQPSPDPEHEAELRALENALRAGQPRSAADIGAFDEREQALLKDAWPDAPVREGQGPIRRRSQHGLSMEETFEARRERMAEERRARKGTLYVVATPIGNLEDMTFRAIRTLKEVRLIAAEDTRQTAKLLNHYQIRTPMTSFFEHNEQLKLEPILRRLDDGQAVALVSDGGTPGISDPGYSLVKAAAERGANVVAIPGACAAVAALSASGLPTDAWAFVGFLPTRDKKRREFLESLKLDRRTLVFYEAPGRVYETIEEMCEILGNRDMVMVREMTKVHEETVRGKFSKVLAEYRGKEIKGEVVLVVSGWQGKVADREGLSIIDRLRLYKQESGLPLADVVRLVARETGTPKSDVYRESLKLVGVDPEKLKAGWEEPGAERRRGEVPAGRDSGVAPRRGGAEAAEDSGRRRGGSPEGDAASAQRGALGADKAAGEANGAYASVALPDTLAAAEPGLAGGDDAGHRISEDAQPDAPAVADLQPAAPFPSAGGGEVAGVEIVEGRPGPAPEIPLAPRQD